MGVQRMVTKTTHSPSVVFSHSPRDSEEIKKVLPPKDLSETDKLKARAEKFGAVSETAKKEKRAERFGIQASSAVTTGSIGTSDTDAAHVEKLKKRAERFGEVVSDKLKKVYEDEKKRKRLERFGTTAASSTEVKKVELNSTDSDLEAAHVEKLKKRAERFGEVVSDKLKKVYEDEKKRKRLERFGTTAASSTEVKKVELNSTDSDLEAAHVEKLKKRAERFGEVVSDKLKKVYEDEKKRKRLERFGTTAASSTEVKKVELNSTDSDLEAAHVEKLKKRAERFGEVVSDKLKKVYEDEKKRKRLERFGTTAASSTEVKKVKLNSTDSDLEERKKKRAERFGLT
ncbi:hypothetical protein ACOMHN_009046 [Nucella lapillus]